MKIAHVLTYVSADGAFGGPLAVASAQAEELALRGHQVEILAGWDGELQFSVPGVKVALFRARQLLPAGFSGLVAPHLLWTLARRGAEFDVIHVHLARDLIAMPAAMLSLLMHRKVRVFVQTHGMVNPDTRLKSRVFDLGIRSILSRCQSVFALNDVEAKGILSVARKPISIVELPNGVRDQAPRAFITPKIIEVLFLARLHKRKRVMVFAKAAEGLVRRGVPATFTVLGPDEGELAELQEFIADCNLTGKLNYDGVLPPGAAPERLSKADVYILPSLNEPFPMSVLEALSVGTPTVISTSCHIAAELVDAQAVVSFDGEEEDLEQLLVELLKDQDKMRQLSASGQKVIREHYSVRHVVDLLLAYYVADRASLRHHRRQYSK